MTFLDFTGKRNFLEGVAFHEARRFYCQCSDFHQQIFGKLLLDTWLLIVQDPHDDSLDCDNKISKSLETKNFKKKQKNL